MPRKRTTRFETVAKPTRNNLAVADSMSQNEKKEQLAIFLKDYDSRVKCILKDIEKKKRALLTFIQTRYEKGISDLPWEIKDMTMEEYTMCGGTIEAALSHVRGAEIDAKQKRLADIQNIQWMKKPLEDITEEGGDSSVLHTAKPTTSKHKRNVGKTASKTTINRARNKSIFVTPAGKSVPPTWGKTPAVTPKFDPSLSITPDNIRKVKPGERIMSMAGSPLCCEQVQLQSLQVAKDELVQMWSGVLGLDLTPNRVEQMLRIEHARIKSL